MDVRHVHFIRFLTWKPWSWEISIFWNVTTRIAVKVKWRLLLAVYYTLVSYFAYSLTLKIEATYLSEVSVDFYLAVQRNIPEDITLHNHRCENLKQIFRMIWDLRFPRRWLWRMSSSGMWRRVELVWTDVSEERINSIFKEEKSTSEESAWLQPPAYVGSSLADFSSLKMDAIRSSETSFFKFL
jgi:hypothetical protein